MSIEKLMEWNTFMCGFIQDKEDSFVQILNNLDDEIIGQIKEDRLFKMVQLDINDFDEKIFHVEEESFEIIHYLSEMIFEELINELITSFN